VASTIRGVASLSAQPATPVEALGNSAVKPSGFYQPIIARTFSTVTHAILPVPPRRDANADVLAISGVDALEFEPSHGGRPGVAESSTGVRHGAVIYGLMAAIGWGTSAIAATNAVKRLGTYIAVFTAQSIGMIVFVLLAAFLRPPLTELRTSAVIGLGAAGLLGLLGYLTFYRALECGGAVGLVSAISATYGGVTTLLAVIVLGEHLGGFGAMGVVLAVVGVAMASARSQSITEKPPVAVAEPIDGVAPGPSRAWELSRAGVPLALASAAAYGTGGFLLGDYSARVGALGSALLEHSSLVAVLLLVLPFFAKRKGGRLGRSGMMWAAAAGVTDAVAVLAFSRGGQVGQVAVTAAVSSAYPVIPLVAGLVMFGERLSRRQLLGILLIVGGLVMIALN